jgi:ABC-type antimicrobial peptide transport system permease subunit
MREQQNEIREINQKTYKKHQREVLWQITLPFLLGVILLLAAGVLVILTGIQSSGQTSLWADISLIWLLIPGILFTFIFLALMSALVYGLVRLNRILPVYTKKLQNIFEMIHQKVKKIMDTAASPVIKVSGFRAALRALLGR